MYLFSKLSDFSDFYDCPATDQARVVLNNANVGDVLYCVQDDGPEGTVIQLFTSARDAANAFNGAHQEWDNEFFTNERAIELAREARFFMQAPDHHAGAFYVSEDFGGGISLTVYAVRVVENEDDDSDLGDITPPIYSRG